MSFHESCLNGNVSSCVKERRVEKEREEGDLRAEWAVRARRLKGVWVTALHGCDMICSQYDATRCNGLRSSSLRKNAEDGPCPILHHPHHIYPYTYILA